MQKEELEYYTNKYNNKTDEEVISFIKEGDEQALTYLLSKYREMVNKLNKDHLEEDDRPI